MRQKLLLLMLTLALWFVLAGRIDIQIFFWGVMICSAISFMLADSVFRFVQMKHVPKALFLKMYYFFLVISCFTFDVFLSAVKISRYAFKVKPSFSPRIIRVETSLEHSNGIALLASFITLPQGSLAMDFDILTRNYTIHWMDVQSDREAEDKKAFIRKHEHWVGKIFDLSHF